MQKNTKLSGMTRLLFTSPYFLLVFLIVPAYVIIGLKLRFNVSGDLLLANNIAFGVCIALRLGWYALKMRGDIRYGAAHRPPSTAFDVARPAAQLQTELKSAGYCFDANVGYGEKRDLGYLGTTVLYAGMLILLMVGSYDYLREYSIMIRIGVGEPMSLDNKGLLGDFEAGFLAGAHKLPLLKVNKQILPNPQWPRGATEIALLSEDRKELAKGTLAPGKSFNYKGLDFFMTKFVFDALMVFKQGNHIAYEGFVKFMPLPQKKGEYSYYASLRNDNFQNVGGVAWLNPEKKSVRIESKLAGKKMFDGELELWGKNKITQGEYLASLDGLAHWSEIRVARARHTLLLIFGAALAILGGLMRLVVRPQRVWLEEAGESCRARAVGGKTLRLLKRETKSDER